MVVDAQDLELARARIAAAYDPSLLKDSGQRLAGLLADEMAEALGSHGPVVRWEDPQVNVDRAGSFLIDAGPETFDKEALADHFSGLVKAMLAHGLKLYDPRYIGHQVPASVPLAGLFDAVGSVTNQVMATYEIAPWAQLFADMVEVTFAAARIWYEKVCEAEDFKALHEPECDILVFRHIPDSMRDASRESMNDFQLVLRRRLVESGAFFIVSTIIDGLAALRVTVINPFTAAEHLDLLVDTLRTEGRALMGSTKSRA